MWPTLLKQSEFFEKEPFSSQAVKGFYFLDYLNNSEFNPYLRQFLNNHGHSNHISFLNDFIKMIMFLNDNALENDMFRANLRVKDPIGLLNNYFISDENLHEFKDAKIKTLKSKPLVKIQDDQYFIVNHDFLISKLYAGLIFDVYYETAFSDEYDFVSYRNEMGKFTDKHYFRQIFDRLIKPDFPKFWAESDQETHEGLPDYYCRTGNHVILIEIKDITFNEDIMQSQNLELIEKTIMNRIAKFGRNAKGAGQLLKTIIKFDSDGFNFDAIKAKQFKNLRIYPLIIHSNHYLKLPGVNLSVHNQFQTELSNVQLGRLNDDNIGSPILIHIDYFLDEFPILRYNRGHKFLDLIKAFSKALRTHKKVSFIPKTYRKAISKPYNSFEYFENIPAGESRPLSVLEKLGIKELIKAKNSLTKN